MDADGVNFLEYGFKGAVGIILAIGSYLWASLLGTVKENKIQADKTKNDLQDHKLHISDNYAKKTELNPIYESLSTIEKDVKVLLGRKQWTDRESGQ